jgi:hypothetical protein
MAAAKPASSRRNERELNKPGFDMAQPSKMTQEPAAEFPPQLTTVEPIVVLAKVP